MSIVAAHRKRVAMSLIALSGLGVLVATSAAPAAGAAGHVPAGDAFYVPPKPLAKAKPGTIIRSTPIDAPAGARAWKILYHSRAVDGSDIAVSGVVVAPTGNAPRGGRVVVTWAHGNVGSRRPVRTLEASRHRVRRSIRLRPCRVWRSHADGSSTPDAGYVVAATDYEGLGTPGLHPFLVGESEGRSVLDAPAPHTV